MDDDYGRRLDEEIGSILTSGETILAIATQNPINSPINRDSAVVTSRRFIIYRPRLLGRMDLEDVLWQDVTDVRLSSKMLGAILEVTARKRLPSGAVEAAEHRIEGLDRAAARKVYAVAQEMEEQWREKNRVRQMEEERARSGGVYLGGAHAPSAPAASVEDRLRKLKSLHEQGLITDAEYESRKSQIISEL
jgi:hypothetical protein